MTKSEFYHCLMKCVKYRKYDMEEFLHHVHGTSLRAYAMIEISQCNDVLAQLEVFKKQAEVVNG